MPEVIKGVPEVIRSLQFLATDFTVSRYLTTDYADYADQFSHELTRIFTTKGTKCAKALRQVLQTL
jgi:hypothetical protein